jgi:ubiquinone biosynthesis protein
MTGRSLRNLEFPAETVAGYRLCERRPDLEGPHTQVYLASKADSPEIDCLIKLVDARELDPEGLDEQVKADGRLMETVAALPAEEADCLFVDREMGMVTARSKEGEELHLLYRITSFSPQTRYLDSRNRDSHFAFWLRDAAELHRSLRRICRAVSTLERLGLSPAYLTSADLIFLPARQAGTWDVRVTCRSSRFLVEAHRAIHRASPALQALWRIHPGFELGRTPDRGSAVFSLGVLFYFILTGRLPYHRPGHVVVTESDLRPIAPGPDQLQQCLEQMLDRDRTGRPTLEQVVAALDEPTAPDALARLCQRRDQAPEPIAVSGEVRHRRPSISRRSIQIVIRIGRLLARLGIRYLISFAGPARRSDTPGIDAAELGREVAAACQDLGPIFTKIGQMAATRSDLFPEEFCGELAVLQQRVRKSLSFDQASTLILDAWRCASLHDVCLEFQEEPIGVASIGQVYRARLLDGSEVVVKVRKPEVDSLVNSDLAILHWLVDRIEARFRVLRDCRLGELARQFDRDLRSELVFETERLNLLEIEANFSSVPYVTIPAVFEALCSDRVLVMGFLRGGQPSDRVDVLDKLGHNRQAVAGRFVEIFVKMILIDGVFHADPHPGNLLLLPDETVGIIDFGAVGRLSEKMRFEILFAIIAILENRPARFVDGLRLMGAFPSTVEGSQLEKDVASLLRLLHLSGRGAGYGLSTFVQGFFKLIPEYRLRVPPDVLVVFKSLLTFEATLFRIDPEIDLPGALKAAITRAFFEQADTKFESGFYRLLREYAISAGLGSFVTLRRVKDLFPSTGPIRLDTESPAAAPSSAARFLPAVSVLILAALTAHLAPAQPWPWAASLLGHAAPVFSLLGFLMAVLAVFRRRRSTDT